MRKVICAALSLTLAGAIVARADEKPMEFSLGLSYLATTGNTDSKTGGIDLDYKRTFDPWGLEVTASYLRADTDGTETANRTLVGIRGDRAFSERFKAFATANWLRDSFAGLDNRYVVGAGISYTAVKSERHELSFDLGVAWNSDHLVDGTSTDYMSGVAGLNYTWAISPNSKLTEKLVFIPSFEDSNDWRVASDTALESAISSKLALKVGYQYLFDNVPVPGFKKTDTRTAVSLVVKL
jgi:putative salt-induced outer membrane protein